jgi:hypothetical protein
MDEKQLKSLHRSADRAVARRGQGDEKLGLFIRVAESAIYRGKPVLKALLKEVIFMRLHDLHENDTRIPKRTPWSRDYQKYEGWCYARQEYLANRVGCTRPYANQALNRIVDDGYLKSRKYKSKDGAWHKQYFPDEMFIDRKIAEFTEKTDGTLVNSVDKPMSDNRTRACQIIEHAHVNSVDMPMSDNLTAGGSLGLGFSSSLEVRSGSTPPFGGSAAAQPSNHELEPKPKTKTNSSPKSLAPDGSSWPTWDAHDQAWKTAKLIELGRTKSGATTSVARKKKPSGLAAFLAEGNARPVGNGPTTCDDLDCTYCLDGIGSGCTAGKSRSLDEF